MDTNDPPPEFAQAGEAIWQNCVVLIGRDVGYQDYVDSVRLLHARMPAKVRDDMMIWPVLACISREVATNSPSGSALCAGHVAHATP